MSTRWKGFKPMKYSRAMAREKTAPPTFRTALTVAADLSASLTSASIRSTCSRRTYAIGRSPMTGAIHLWYSGSYWLWVDAAIFLIAKAHGQYFSRQNC